ncbi:hypothetical protein [Erwinia amylovora]|uniref:hypothetical protein n=1 Tax=Erwinia amylovora TaxID=552 RepID=UPI0027BA9CCC|nr:hypothetical protein [Erwinia amylovora]
MKDIPFASRVEAVGMGEYFSHRKGYPDETDTSQAQILEFLQRNGRTTVDQLIVRFNTPERRSVRI